MKFKLLLTFYFLFTSLLFGQSIKYKKFKYEWPTTKPEEIKVIDIFKKEDAVILEEECIYNEGGNRVPEYTFINFSANYAFLDRSVRGVNPIVKKHVRIKFLTQKGINKFKNVLLPESFDPANDLYNVRPQWRDSIHRPMGEFECIRHFAARIIKEDGTVTNAIVKEKTFEYLFQAETLSNTYYIWLFQIENLNVGDELEMDYSYEGVYNFGYSDRIFFHQDIPIQKLNFSFVYPEKDLYILTYHNGGNPVDSIMVTPNTPHTTVYKFYFENLKGCINEAGARTYKELPFFTFYYHNRDYGIPDPKTNFIMTALPYPWPLAAIRSVGYQYEDLKLRLSRKDFTTVRLNKYTAELQKNSFDSSAASIVTELQHDLAENFAFKEDPNFYLGQPREIYDLGDNIENKILKQMSRIRIYDEVLIRLDQPFYHSLLTDNRLSEIDINRFEPIVASRVAIAVPYNDYILFYFPKSYRYGFESNELPFYYENAKTLLSPQTEKSEKKYEHVPLVQFKFIKTPSSDKTNNTRKTSCKVSISLDSMKVALQTKINLSGQFSTLTRGYYKYGSIDTTINPAYYHIISQTADDQLKIKTNITPVNKKYPFDVTVTQEFTSSNHLQRNGEKEFTLKFENWFNNITDDFHAENRCLEYYPDFQSQDIHRYLLHFDHAVEIKNLDSLTKKLNNSFTEYGINASQPGPYDVLIECSYIVKPVSVPAKNAKDVESAFEMIHALNNYNLKIRMTD
jgi:hypothetical protein